ncbi:uncharacterized protein [Macrobrachium rosenbergii]|uniref:uncharacterized protein n=1 Tax=Macrobrachium rosenbergii TaxID=79674 RepID=UPI0034D3FE01
MAACVYAWIENYGKTSTFDQIARIVCGTSGRHSDEVAGVLSVRNGSSRRSLSEIHYVYKLPLDRIPLNAVPLNLLIFEMCKSLHFTGEEEEDSARLSSLEARIVAAYSTRTVITLTTTTATAVSTCNQASGTNACQKRRIRRFNKLSNVDQEEDGHLADLQSALEEVPEGEPSNASSPREGRIALTIWTTTSSTYTITTTSTNTSTTLSISYYCSIVGGNMFGSCG